MTWSKNRPGISYLLSILAIAVLLRALIASLPPVLDIVEKDLGLSRTAAGATTTLPLICFGVFAFAAPALARRVGTSRALTIAMMIMAIGTLMKIWPHPVGLFTGTLFMGIGVAIGNVLLPVAVRENYPGRVPQVMSGFSACINLGSAVGAALTIPTMQTFGWTWNLALGAWIIPQVAVLILWLRATWGEDRPEQSRVETTTRYGELIKRRLIICLVLLMGLQSGFFYSLLTWIPAQLKYAGLTPAQSGSLLGLFSLIGLLGGIAGAWVIGAKSQNLLFSIMYIPCVAGAVMVPLGSFSSTVGIVLVGLGQGAAYASMMALIASVPNPADVSSTSALAQGIGYLIASVFPMGLGLAQTLSNGWTVPIIAELVVLIAIYTVAMIAMIELKKEKIAWAKEHPTSLV